MQKSGAKDESSRSGTLTFNMERTYGLSPSKGRRYGAEPRFRFVSGLERARGKLPLYRGRGASRLYWGPCTRP
jgi:hypothetical protein